MVSIFRYSEISECNSRIQNPLSESKLVELGRICRPIPGQRHLDLACGKGEMLCLFARNHGTLGLGIDIYPPFLASARLRAAELGGRLAVVTGGGSGMGRELVIQLAAEGCSVATCDVNADNMGETARRAEKDAPVDVRISTHLADVSDETQMNRFRDEVVAQHQTDHVNLLFNNAGIGGGGSFLTGSRDAWDKTFAVCWGGVYNGMRAFADLLVASDEGYVINTSSVNGFWASLGPGFPHTAYSAAKFAVKGFTEALIEDFRVNAPHVKVAVVMPGHVGTDIVINSHQILLNLDEARGRLARHGVPTEDVSDDEIRNMVKMMGETFRDNAPLTAAQAATIILDGVHAGKWRILVGDDAHALDEAVRADPDGAYGERGLSLGTITDQ